MVAVLGVVRSRGKRKRDAVGQPLTERKESVIDTVLQKAGRLFFLPFLPSWRVIMRVQGHHAPAGFGQRPKEKLK